MRQTGSLRRWNEERGFGFIAPTQGGREVFVHINALARDGTHPVDGETLSFEVEPGNDGRPRAVRVHRAAFGAPDRRATTPVLLTSATTKRKQPVSAIRLIALFMVIVVASAYGYARYARSMSQHTGFGPTTAIELANTGAKASGLSVTPSTRFTCDGRRYCSQMTSCPEARFFLAHCPATQMDGDHDGIPCESQWCSAP